MLGIILALAVWLICRFKTSCKVFRQHHENQSLALHSIARSLGGRSLQAAPTGLPISRSPDKNIFLDLKSPPVTETS